MTVDLHEALLDAHADQDHAALVSLYLQAWQSAGEQDAAAFFATQAYIYSLEQGDARATALHAQLVAAGREA